MNRMLMQGFCNGLDSLLSESARGIEARTELDIILALIGGDSTVPLAERVKLMAKDAERYRKMRRKAQYDWRNGPGLYWYLPRDGERDLTAGERLDNSLDAEPA